MTKDMHVDAVEQVGEDYQAGELDLEEAIKDLCRLGFDPHQAETLLKEQYSDIECPDCGDFKCDKNH